MNFYAKITHAVFISLLGASCNNSDSNNITANKKIQIDQIDGPEQLNAKSTVKNGLKMNNDSMPIAKASRFDFPSCEKLKAENLSEEQLIEHLDAHYPADLINDKIVEKADLKSHDIAQLTGYAACIASLTLGPDAPESALALFASKRYGKSAMAALEQQAQGSTDAAKAARQFADQMKSYLEGPGE